MSGGLDTSRGALISSCGKYRYSLWRGALKGNLLPFVMLNPSTADADLDDPTIRRCMSFARREGFEGIIVCNLFGFRSPSPAAMKAEESPVGPRNDMELAGMLAMAMHRNAPVVAAWGVHGSHRSQDTYFMALARQAGVRLVCLGVTKDGHPKHPLYVPGDQPLVAFPVSHQPAQQPDGDPS